MPQRRGLLCLSVWRGERATQASGGIELRPVWSAVCVCVDVSSFDQASDHSRHLYLGSNRLCELLEVIAIISLSVTVVGATDRLLFGP
jgi:hypothetical protein